MAVTPQADRLAAQFNRLVARVRLASTATVLLAWDRLPRYDEDLVADFLATITPVVTGTQAQVAAATDAYLAAFTAAETGVPDMPKGLPAKAMTGAAVRNGADAVDVYRRPFVTVWGSLAKNQPWQHAVDAGRARLASTVETDVMLSHRQAVAEWTGTDERIVGFRRVLSGQSCGLCAAASTQRYKSGELMPIHGRCDCTVQPIVGNVDPGQVIDRDRWRQLRRNADTSSRSSLARERVTEDGQVIPKDELPDVQVVEHGELGPTLTDRSHEFTGPGGIAA